jgi:hypothetical protein
VRTRRTTGTTLCASARTPHPRIVSNNRGVAAGRASTSTVPPHSGLSTPTTKASDGNPVPALRGRPGLDQTTPPPVALATLVVPTIIYSERIDTLPTELSDLVRAKIGAIASLSGVGIVPGLPKTRSGKILRRNPSADRGRGNIRYPLDDREPHSRGDRQSPPPLTPIPGRCNHTVGSPTGSGRPTGATSDCQSHPTPYRWRTTSAPGDRFAAAELAPPSAGSLHSVVGRYPQPPNRIDTDAATFGVHPPETPRTAVSRIIAGTAKLRALARDETVRKLPTTDNGLVTSRKLPSVNL